MHKSNHDPDIADVESAVRTLAQADAADASRGLEDRIFNATVDRFRETQPVVVARLGVYRAVLAVAAAIGIVALASVWFTASPTPPVAPDAVAHAATLDAIDAWLGEGPLAAQEDDLDDIFHAIVSFDPRSADDWTVDDLITSEGDSL